MYIGGGGETTEPANKRARLESVIPVKTAPLPAVKAAQPAPLPPPRPVPPPFWPAAGEPARHSLPERPTAGRPGRPKHERRPARFCEDGPPKGWAQGRAPGRPLRPPRGRW